MPDVYERVASALERIAAAQEAQAKSCSDALDRTARMGETLIGAADSDLDAQMGAAMKGGSADLLNTITKADMRAVYAPMSRERRAAFKANAAMAIRVIEEIDETETQ